MATRDEIEAQIAADPYDDAPYAILADLLQLEGDPRGELIAIDLATERAQFSDRAGWRQRRASLLARHPELAPPQPADIEYGWHLGFVRRVTAYPPYNRDLIEHPALSFTTELVLPDERGSEAKRIGELVRALPRLRMLALGDPDGINYGQPSALFQLDDHCDLSQLHTLFAASPVRFRTAPRLRSLGLTGVAPETLRWLCEAKLPMLERLSLHLRTPTLSLTQNLPLYEHDQIPAIEHLAALLATPLPRLVELELIDVSCGDALVRELARAPLLRQLHTLRLWNAGITLDGAHHVTREAFGHLALLDLTDPTLDEPTAAQLSHANPNTRTSSTRLGTRLGGQSLLG